MQAQWDTWDAILKKELRLPYVSCIRNHDIWGWGLDDDVAAKDDPLYGKALALEALGLENRYYTFEKAGWQFFVLDSMEPMPSNPGAMSRAWMKSNSHGWKTPYTYSNKYWRHKQSRQA